MARSAPAVLVNPIKMKRRSLTVIGGSNILKSKSPHAIQSFQNDLHGHFALADPAIFEQNGNLLGFVTHFEGAIFHFDLKTVTIGLYRVEIHAFENLAFPGIESTRPIANRKTQDP